MLIYEEEIKDGLRDKLSNNTFSFASVIENKNVSTHNINDLLKIEITEASLKDYSTLTSILASTGWNGNSDVFEPKELWKAKKTPIYKKLDFNHNEKDVVGTIIDSYAINDDGDIIGDDITEDNLPDSFHIVNKSILWTFWKDEELKDRMENLLSEIAEGKWFVSMEAIFNNFDYAIITPDGEELVLARNKKTSFLTKHLLQYGGAGEYQGHKIGRVLKDFVFVGKGIVKQPANSKSLILSLANSNNFNTHSKLDFYSFSLASVYSTDIKEKEMSEELVKELREQLAEAMKISNSLKDENDKLAAIVDEFNETKFKNIEAKLETVEACLCQEKEKVTATEQALETLKSKASELENENQKLKNEQVEALKQIKIKERAMILVNAGMEENLAKEKANSWIDVDETIFKDYVSVIEASKKTKENADTSTIEETSASLVEDVNEEETIQETEASNEEVKVSSKLKEFAKASLQTYKNGE